MASSLQSFPMGSSLSSSRGEHPDLSQGASPAGPGEHPRQHGFAHDGRGTSPGRRRELIRAWTKAMTLRVTPRPRHTPAPAFEVPSTNPHRAILVSSSAAEVSISARGRAANRRSETVSPPTAPAAKRCSRRHSLIRDCQGCHSPERVGHIPWPPTVTRCSHHSSRSTHKELLGR